jgi:hypothetical protein
MGTDVRVYGDTGGAAEGSRKVAVPGAAPDELELTGIRQGQIISGITLIDPRFIPVCTPLPPIPAYIQQPKDRNPIRIFICRSGCLAFSSGNFPFSQIGGPQVASVACSGGRCPVSFTN